MDEPTGVRGLLVTYRRNGRRRPRRSAVEAEPLTQREPVAVGALEGLAAGLAGMLALRWGLDLEGWACTGLVFGQVLGVWRARRVAWAPARIPPPVREMLLDPQAHVVARRRGGRTR